MKHEFLAIILILAFSNSIASCVIWNSNVDTNSSHWSIYRQSSNMSFHLSSSVNGKISAVDFRGRIITPYQSYYEEIGANDVRLKERTSSKKGIYKSTDEISMLSRVDVDSIDISIDKFSGSDIFVIEYLNETWPVSIVANRSLMYFGQQINNRDFEGNNGDFVGTNFLYNQEFSKEQKSFINLKKMNAIVQATNDAILMAELRPTKYLGYIIKSKSTGIADLSYRLRNSQYDVKHQLYPAAIEGEEQYYGALDLTRKIEMRSSFEKSNSTDDVDSWLPCCNGGLYDINLSYDGDFVTDIKGIFDCTCLNERMNTPQNFAKK